MDLIVKILFKVVTILSLFSNEIMYSEVFPNDPNSSLICVVTISHHYSFWT